MRPMGPLRLAPLLKRAFVPSAAMRSIVLFKKLATYRLPARSKARPAGAANPVAITRSDVLASTGTGGCIWGAGAAVVAVAAVCAGGVVGTCTAGGDCC